MQAIASAIGDITRLPRNECMSSLQSAEVNVCEFGDTSSGINIVLFGDSHAIQWFNPLERIAELNGWKLTTMVKSACPAFDIKPLSQSAGSLAACAGWRAEALQRIIALRPTIVFIANSTSYLGNAKTFQGDANTPSMTFAFENLQDGTRRTLQALAGLRVVLMRDTPYFSYYVPTCLARSVRHAWYPGGSARHTYSSSSMLPYSSQNKPERTGCQTFTLSTLPTVSVSKRFADRSRGVDLFTGTTTI